MVPLICRSLCRLPSHLTCLTIRSLSSSSVNMKTIGTHSGTFHCDEVLACGMLKLLPEYKDAEIVRSRDPKVLEPCDIVVDVGGVFDHEKKRCNNLNRS